MTKIKPNVVRGGKATNIGGNLYYMNGRKHSQGGIDIGKNPKTGLEVEDGEIVETRPDSLRVFSAQPIINGNSPAKLVMGGANPDKVFQAQETFKDVNGINDDGSKKRMGGKVKIRRRTNTEIDEELGLVPNKNRKAAGGFVTVNGNVIDKLVGDVHFPPPTGGRKKAALGTDKRDKDYVVMNGQLYQVIDAASRDAKGARTDFRNMLEVPEFTPGTYSGGNRNTGTRSTNSAPQTRVTPIEEAPATTAATKTSKPATSSAPRRRSGSSKTTKTSATATPTAAPKFASLDSMMQGLPTLSRNTPTTIPTRTVDGASTNAGVPDTISSPRKRLALFDKLDTNDIIGLGANLAGTIASGINTRKALNKMEAPPQPNPVIASNLKTDFNISPQLGEIEENARRMVTDINANTSSSRTRLQRLQRTRNQAQNYKNSLRGQKENIETQLINQDRLNKQGVRATNVAAMNDWQNRSAAFRNSIREQKASSLNNVFSGINTELQDMLSRIENRRNYNNTLRIYDATHPNVDRRLFTSKGVTF